MKVIIFITLFLCLIFVSNGQTLIFSDDFATADLSDYIITKTSDDTSVESGYDYSTLGLPQAPNNADFLALRTAANITGGNTEVINIYYNTPINVNRYMVQVDIYLRWPEGGSGTTEHCGVGIFASGTKLNNPHAYGGMPTDTDGLTFGYNSDADEALSDFYLTLGSPTGQTDVGTWTNPTNPDPLGQYYEDEPYATIAGAPGVFGNQWMTVKFFYEAGLATVRVKDTTVVTYDASALGAGADKLAFLVHTDPFSSLANPSDESFCLFDNLMIYELPEPARAGTWILYE